jgi:hypothetical protein
MRIIPSLKILAITFCAAFLNTAGAQPLTITTIAGQFKQSTLKNGVGTNALFYAPSGICADAAGNLYVIDLNAIRKISSKLTVNTIQGIESDVGYQDASTNALFADPWDLAVDKNGYIYVADWGNNVVRKISPLGVVTTLAGNGTPGYVDAKVTMTVLARARSFILRKVWRWMPAARSMSRTASGFEKSHLTAQ